MDKFIEKNPDLKFITIENDRNYYYCTPDKLVIENLLSPLHKLILISMKYPDVIEIIREYIRSNENCLLARTEPAGWTPLMVACINAGTRVHSDVIDIILENMGNVNDFDNFGSNILNNACKYLSFVGSELIIKLINWGANGNHSDNFQMNSLMSACFYYDFKMNRIDLYHVSEALLKRGLYINQRNNNGMTVLGIYLIKNEKEGIYNEDQLTKLYKLYGGIV